MEKFYSIIISIVNWTFLTVTIVYTIGNIGFPMYRDNMSFISALIIILQIIVILMEYMYEQNIDKNIFKGEKRNKVQAIKSEILSEIEYSRRELRFGLNILMTFVVIVLMLMIYITRQYYLILGIGLIGVICYIYADYLPHAKAYAEKYDRMFTKDGMENSIRGLARIYLEEYEQTNFNTTEYKKLDNSNDILLPDIKYMKSVLWARIDSISNSYITYAIALLIVNILALYPDLYKGVLDDVVDVTRNIFNFVLMVISVMASIAMFMSSVKQSEKYKKDQKEINKIIVIFLSNDSNRIKNCYLKLINGADGDLYRVRGAFFYTMKCIDDGINLSTVPLSCRMLYMHKSIANMPRLKNTMILLTVSIVLILIEFFGITTALLIPVMANATIYFLVKKLVLPNLGKNRLMSICEEIKKEQVS